MSDFNRDRGRICGWQCLLPCLLLLVLPTVREAVAARPLNVLFIAIDDLRPQLGCCGHPEMVTPHLDRLARQGRLFSRHYVQVPTCGASRYALLTGRYPSAPQSFGNNAFGLMPRKESARPDSLPQLFRQNGYRTVCLGKISHSPDGRHPDGTLEVPFAWDEVGIPAGKWGTGWNAFFGYADGSTRTPGKTPSTERGEVADDGYPDGLIAGAAVAKLRELKDKPFFLAVGFFKPHLPFNAPARYWDLYDPDRLPLPIPSVPARNTRPAISLHKSSELTPRYTGLAVPGQVSASEGRHLRQAYAACVSYVDAQVGRVLNEVDALGLRDQTVVVVWGDHGWHLGEHGIWGKHTLHEVALHSPLIVRTPKMKAPGQPADGLVESVDIYPTLAEVCGLPVADGLAGTSFTPLLADPAKAGKLATFGYWRGGHGRTIRTDRYRLVQWTARKGPPRVVQVELYDHQTDPHETVNIAADQAEIVRDLTAKLQR